ncbi:ferrous iron transport protein B [Desulfocicer vacuolatum DSM 3385]|uniref:Ferrous iron transport protein B n=1 Tax=Desulfocicer vacuolatum DSM 3385 TaxID=1121400 RepID=A0A1W1ZVL5_9BACT|nr:ferrous iron transport protein B [Desulfocicer vacuolatum]SMC52098.1 ferrous iron transport protein B [Desulfocicer vacuolatum DSM 3385]
MKNVTVALAGNPNSGKTTIFNNLTGARQKVGNWPGVTVEKKEGTLKRNGYELKIVDLPGTYSLTPFSIEEIAARDFILDEKPDVVVNIIDAANLERSLYLAMQIMELDRPVVFALNMADLARSKGISIDAQRLSILLDVPVIFTVGNRDEGMDELVETAVRAAESFPRGTSGRKVKYNREIESLISELKKQLEQHFPGDQPHPVRWTAIKLLESDQVVAESLAERSPDLAQKMTRLAAKSRFRLETLFHDDPEIVLTDDRYGFIAGIVKEVVTLSPRKRADMSRNIDLLLTNRFLGFPIFIFFIWAMFQLTFSLGAYPMEWIESGVSLLSGQLDILLPHGLLKDLLVDGIVAGIGSVIVFLPNILILFFCIALFEDTGYMARTAFLMDRVMHMVGLHGKSFIPMLMGFGCNVPAIMATRSLENRKDRILTILITPFMSCSARLPVYIILAGTFFGTRAGSVIFGLYFTGIVVAIVSGRLFRSTLLRGEDAPFVMELPPYRVPMLKSLVIHMWDRSKMFLKKMGGVILVGSIVIWALSTFPRVETYSRDYSGEIEKLNRQGHIAMAAQGEHGNAQMPGQMVAGILELEKLRNQEQVERSFIGGLGKAMEPLFSPLGIDWRSGVALVTGLVAKEVVVSTMGVLYGIGDSEPDALKAALKKSGMTPLSALSMMVFVLLYVPCLATIFAIWKETSAGWACFNLLYTTSMAWMASFLLYQGGKVLGF